MAGKQTTNYGVYVEGGKLIAESIVVGDGTRINKVESSSLANEETRLNLKHAISTLDQEVRRHASKLDDHAKVLVAIEALISEADKEEPNQITLAGITEGIKEATGTVSALAGAVGAVLSLVSALG